MYPVFGIRSSKQINFSFLGLAFDLSYSSTKTDDAIDYANFCSRSHDAVIRVYDEAGNVIETHEHKRDFNRVVSAIVLDFKKNKKPPRHSARVASYGVTAP